MGFGARDGRLAASYVYQSLAAAALALGFASSAVAAPAQLTGRAIEARIIRGIFTVNLRDIGVITGTAPLMVQPQQLAVYRNNERIQSVGAVRTGNVCVTFINQEFTPGPNDVFSVDLGVSNREGQDGPVRVPLTGNTGPTVNPQDPSCLDEAEVNSPPTANAGGNRTIQDTNGLSGENVAMIGSASDPDGDALTYQWHLDGAAVAGATALNSALQLADGANDVMLRVTDSQGQATDSRAQITVVAPVLSANAGPDQNVPDDDGQPGERVTLTGSATGAPSSITRYEWFRGQTSIGVGPTITPTIPDGVNDIQLRVTYVSGLVVTDDVRITVTAPANQPPIANAGPDQSIPDRNGVAGEPVTLNASGSRDPDGTIVSYRWTIPGEEPVTTQQPTFATTLLDGVHTITLTVTDDAQATATDTVQVTVGAPTRPIADAGEDDIAEVGQTITLDGRGSSDSDGTIVRWEWYEGESTLGVGATLPVQLSEGVHNVLLVVTDNSGLTATDTVQIAFVEPGNGGFDVDLGPPQSLRDSDGLPGELVTLSPTIPESEETLRYTWVLDDRVISREAALRDYRLPNGANELYFEVSEDLGEGTGRSASDTVIITVGAPQAPTVDAGGDVVVEEGQSVTLTATANDPDGEIVSYQWSSGEDTLGTEQTLTHQFALGEHNIMLRVTDAAGMSASDTVRVTVTPREAPEAQPPTANAGADQTVNDADGQAGELVNLNGSDSTDADGSIASYQWFIGETLLGSGATLQARVPDGVTLVRLVVTDNAGLTASDDVQITVAAPVLPIVNAGLARTIEDTDVQAGEDVQLSGSATGTITQYQWLLGNTVLGTGATITARLPDGVNLVTLRATNSAGLTGSASVQITVSIGVRTVLANIPGLTPNERKLAEKLDEVCNNILGPLTGVTETIDRRETTPATKRRPPTEAEQSDFAQKCRGLLKSKDNVQLANAMGQILGDDFAVARTQTLLFANTQYASVMDRLIALRGGAKGLSLAGLNIMVDGEMIPLAELQGLAKQLLGGGASSDADGALWNDKWGLWARGNYSFGSKEDDRLSPSFDADQFALLAGLDYRLTETAVIGGALAYGNSSVEFNPSSEGSLDTESWAISLYGSLYAKKNFYFDTIVNVASSGYDAERNITYVDGYGLVNTDADGETDGLTLSGGLSGGYDFLIGGLTISPTLGVFYIDAQIDEFTEAGAGGLNLIYDEQQFKSLTGNLGVRMTFAWNLPWGVLLPHFRADFVREFEDEVDVFGIRFASDPNAASTPPILVETENPDSSYWRLAAGFSAQFRHGISGYVEYQRLESFEAISFQDISLGLRFQAAF